MSMNQTIAGLYNTAGVDQPTNEDHEKVAQAQLFAKLAADNNIDLKSLDDNQISALWESTFGKEASDEEEGGKPPMPPAPPKKDDDDEDDDEDEDEKKEAAVAEFYQVKTAHDQVAFFDYCGRVMAHSYVNELSKIAAVNGDDEQAKTAAAETPEDTAQRIAKLAAAAPGMPQAAEGRSTTQNFDLYAARHAVELAKQAGVDENQVVSKLNSVLTLGAPASTKLASANDIDQGIQVRALELLESAGYQVDWNA